MIKMDLFYRLLLAHIVADFILQSTDIAEKKNQSWIRLLQHGVLIFISALILSLNYVSMNLVILCAALSIVHMSLDKFKVTALERIFKEEWKSLAVDQLLHLFSIPILMILTGFLDYTNTVQWVKGVYGSQTTIIYLTGYCLTIWGGAVFVKKFLNMFELEGMDKGLIDAGRYIGILERIAITTLVIFNQYSAIGFILAAKSIARFKELDDRKFAEYYLIGTLMSSLFALAVGLLIIHI